MYNNAFNVHFSNGADVLVRLREQIGEITVITGKVSAFDAVGLALREGREFEPDMMQDGVPVEGDTVPIGNVFIPWLMIAWVEEG